MYLPIMHILGGVEKGGGHILFEIKTFWLLCSVSQNLNILFNINSIHLMKRPCMKEVITMR